MGINGWRWLLVSSKAHISVQGNTVSVRQDDSVSQIPLAQLQAILIENASVTLSAAFLTSMAQESISVIFCDKKYMPAAEMVSLYNSKNNRLGTQMQWEDSQKDCVWKQILHQKLQSEIELLQKYDLPNTQALSLLQEQIPSEKKSDIIESQAARYYLNALYGKGFCRRTENNINNALNYGYAIILSAISRAIAIHGLHPAIGLHHASRRNPYNLSCDLIEPFRAMVDEYVYCYPDRELDWSFKKELIDLINKQVSYNRRKMQVNQAIDRLVLDVIAAMKNPEKKIGALYYAG